MRRARVRPLLLVGASVLSACALSGPREAAPVEATADGREPAPVRCSAATPEQAAACVDAQRYRADLEAVAILRPPGSPGWRVVGDRCADTFEKAGLAVERHEFDTGVNIIGRRAGNTPDAPAIVIGAHYDHLPGCEGADDNASGVAAVLELARVLVEAPSQRALVLACWDDEEAGLHGSRAWAREADAAGEPMALAVSLDGIAYTDSTPGAQRIPNGLGVAFPDELRLLEEHEFRADFIAVVGDERTEPFARILVAEIERVGRPSVALMIPTLLLATHLVPDLERSDHASFWAVNVPALVVSDTANFRSDAYHCRGRPDTLDTIDAAFAVDVLRGVAAAAATWLAG